METETTITAVERSETRNGNTRFVVRDADGREYTTFRPSIGEQAERNQGKRATLEYHEQERNGFQNVYLDAVKPAAEPEPAAAAAQNDSDPDEVAWNTAVEAARGCSDPPSPRRRSSPTSCTRSSSRSSSASRRTSATAARDE